MASLQQHTVINNKSGITTMDGANCDILKQLCDVFVQKCENDPF